jgi:predicted RNase H-like nuclease (RuvC/YqgF family)
MIKLAKAEAITLRILADALDTAKSELTDYLNEMQSDWEKEYDERSESWQNSEAGLAAQERRDTLQCLIDEVEQIDINVDIDALS